MAEENQGRSPGTPRGIPGTQAPPVPSAEQVAKIMAEQQAAIAQQRFEAQKRAAEMAGMPVPKQEDLQQFNRVRPPEPSVQQERQRQANMQQGNQFAQYSQQEAPNKTRVAWAPTYNNGIEVELADAIIFGIPKSGIVGENNPSSKVVLCLFSEILALREQIAMLMEGGGSGANADVSRRLSALEGVLYEQRKGMSARARSVREQVELLTAKGMSAEEIVSSLSRDLPDSNGEV